MLGFWSGDGQNCQKMLENWDGLAHYKIVHWRGVRFFHVCIHYLYALPVENLVVRVQPIIFYTSRPPPLHRVHIYTKLLGDTPSLSGRSVRQLAFTKDKLLKSLFLFRPDPLQASHGMSCSYLIGLM